MRPLLDIRNHLYVPMVPYCASRICIKRECTMKIRRDMTRISLLRRLFIFRSHGQNIRDTTRDSRKGHDNKNRGRRRRARHERGFSRGQRKRVCASRNNNLQLPRWYILQGRDFRRHCYALWRFSSLAIATLTDLSHARQSVVTSALALIRPVAESETAG